MMESYASKIGEENEDVDGASGVMHEEKTILRKVRLQGSK